MTMTAAAPSFRGQALPAVTVPPSRKTGFSCASPSTVVPGRGPSSLVDDGAVLEGDGDDLALEEAVALGLDGPLLAEGGELVHLLAGHLLVLGHVLGRLAHGDVDVGQPLRGRPRVGDLRGPGLRPALGLGEGRVVGPGVRRAVLEPAHRLHAGGHEDVALAGPDGVGGHADGLEGGGAVAVDGHAGHVQSGQEGGHPADVVAGLARRLAAAHDEVLDLGGVELGDLGQDLGDDVGRQVVGSARHQRALVGTTDGGASGGDDDGFGHGRLLLGWVLRRLRAHRLGRPRPFGRRRRLRRRHGRRHRPPHDLVGSDLGELEDLPAGEEGRPLVEVERRRTGVAPQEPAPVVRRRGR